MANLSYAHPMTGVRVTRNEVLNARPWAIVKLIGFVIACLMVAGLVLPGRPMLAGAKINFHAPTAPLVPPPSMPAAPPIAAPALVPPAPAPAPPVTAQIIPTPAPPAPTAPAPSSPEELERAFKGKLLAEGENP